MENHGVEQMIDNRIFRSIRCIVLAMILAVMLCVPATGADGDSVAQPPTLSDGQRNIVKRARQMTEVRWTPNEDVVGWKSEYTYQAGTTYQGLPYGQPIYADYVPWETSLLGFVRAVNAPDSKMYTAYSEYGARAPYYSVDCSAFVSWAWGLDSRKTTVGLRDSAKEISRKSYEQAQVGDCLCLSGVHAVLITDITYDESGKINSVEISEATTNLATNYCCQVTRYGVGGSRTLKSLNERYFDQGYILYRSKTRDNVTYTHSCAVPLEGDNCAACSGEVRDITVESLYAVGAKQVTLYVQPRKDATTVGTVTAKLDIAVAGSCEDAQGALWYQTWGGAWFPGEGITTRCRHDYKCIEETQSTCKTPGEKTFLCNVCGESKTEELAVVDHSYENGSCIWCGVEGPKLQPGDFDGDGFVTEEDVIHLLWHTVMPDGYLLNQNGDYNGDGFVTEEDVIYLLWHTVSPETYPLG